MSITLLQGDCRELLDTLPTASVQQIVTSPPYWRLRRYTDDPREIGQEDSPAAYVTALVDVFERCRRVLRDDGTLWIVIGDAYAGSGKGGGGSFEQKERGRRTYSKGMATTAQSTGLPAKSLIGLPWRAAFALQDRGWILRNEIVWRKPRGGREAVYDRCSRDHETVFLFSKSPRYFFDWKAIAPPTAQADRPQYKRALELAQGAGLTDAHFAAIRAAGITDTGKAARTQSGTGKNTAEVQRLAAEAKQALGGYYREFLISEIKRPPTVWTIDFEPLADDHYAPMPLALAERCIKAGSRPGDTVLDPFAGSGTTGRAALALQRSAVLIDLAYTDLQERRTDGVQVQMVELL